MENKYIDAELKNKWYNLLNLGLLSAKLLKKRRSVEIGSSLEAGLVIGLEKTNRYLRGFDNLNEVFVVSLPVSLEDSKEAYIKVEKAKGRNARAAGIIPRKQGKGTKNIRTLVLNVQTQ